MHAPAVGEAADVDGHEPEIDDQLLDLMLEHAILIYHAIVVAPLGTKLRCPSEAVLDILPNPDIGPFTKDDGEVVIDASGRSA